jgi:hypothetical protein
VWRALPTLSTARLGAGVTIAPDPSTASRFYLYAVGGNSGTPAAPSTLANVEFLSIDVDGFGSQTFGNTWTTAGSALPTGRWLSPAIAETPENNPQVSAGQSFLVSGSGVTSSLGTADKTVYIASVGAAGQPSAWASSGSVGVLNSAAAQTIVNGRMFAFGGFAGGTAAATGVTVAAFSSTTALGNFNASGTILNAARALEGLALDSALLYLVGGASGAIGTAQTGTEFLTW